MLTLMAGTTAFAAGNLLSVQAAEMPLSSELRQIYSAGVPATIDDLRLMDRHQQDLVKKVTRVTVGLQIGSTQGSGVLVSRDGYVLTAAHVAGQAGLDVRVTLPDGRRFSGTTLGMNKGIDAALVKIRQEAGNGQQSEWPYAEMGRGANAVPGSWCLALGHPGGYRPDRQPVARFGRVLFHNGSAITTDCKLTGGDSGGPLFDMEGNVIGVHSRIGTQVTKNLHVPVDAYRDSWTRLARGDSWGSLLTVVGRPVIGVLGDQESDLARIVGVVPASPAERAGVRPGDLVTRFGDEKVDTFDDLKKFVGQRQPGDEVSMEVLRGGKKMVLKVVLAALAGS